MEQARDRSIIGGIDWWVVAIYACLMAMGWVTICGASYDIDQGANFFDLATRSGMQIVWIASAVGLAFVVSAIDERVHDSFAYIVYLLFMLLLLVTPFLARDIKGSLSWIKIGPYSIQPAVFALFPTALCLGKYISRQGFSMQRPRDFIMTCAIILLPMVLTVMQHETGCALVFAALFVMLYREGMPGQILFTAFALVAYFVVGVRFGHTGAIVVLTLALCFSLAMEKLWRMALAALLLSAVLFVVDAYSALDARLVLVPLIILLALWCTAKAVSTRKWRHLWVAAFALGSLGFHFSCDKVMNDVLEPHLTKRIRVLLGIEDDPRGAGYNVNQSQIAIASGGIVGKGFMNGTQTKLKYVPEQDTDFIFCTVGEEEGFAGCAVVLILFLILILRLIALAEKQPDTLPRVYGYSVASVFLFHVFINVGMVLGLTPVIGIPLPFFSYGGSSLWAFTILLFIFLRMDSARKRRRR